MSDRDVEALTRAGMALAAAHSRAAMFERVEAALQSHGVKPVHRFHVPGRIEVLGKHTDYAGGRSLVAAVERGFCVASAPRADEVVRLIDMGRNEEELLSIVSSTGTPAHHWALYPATVVRRLARDFAPPLRGADIAFLSDLPPSSGLSSSSALVIATFEALSRANDLESRPDFQRALPTRLDIAAYVGSVETGRPFAGFSAEAGVGVAGGSQDQTAILASEAGRICRFGFAPIRAEGSVAIPPGLSFVIGVSGVAAPKASGARDAYNLAAARSAALLDVWRDATSRNDATLFDAMTSHDGAPAELKSLLQKRSTPFPAHDLEIRLDQFVDECLVLIPQAFEALGRSDLKAFGEAVDRSQAGAERGLQNQIPETIELPRIARSLGAHAASAFGAGFGGSVWALASTSDVERFMREWESEYRKRFVHQNARFFTSNAGPPLLHL